MRDSIKKRHWEDIYHTRDTTTDVSWYQNYPKISVDLVLSAGADKDDFLIDIGGGDARLVDALLELDFKNLFVLDISAEALGKAKIRLKNEASVINWVESDVLEFDTDERFDIWHDRATFHFLTRQKDIVRYAEVANKLIKPGGHLIMATFSMSGPEKCSGLDITQYSEDSIKKTFSGGFSHIRSLEETHVTPFKTAQNFLWSVFKKS